MYVSALSIGDFFTRLGDRFYASFIEDGRYMYIVNGLGVTLALTLMAALLGIIIGMSMALVKVINLQTGKMKVLTKIVNAYLAVIRGTPSVVQLLIVYFVIFGSVNVPKILVAALAFGLNSGAYVAEIVRAGILAVDPGQMEAGRSLGLGMGQTYRYIILPQAMKNILPALGNEFIVLLKETAIAGYIALEDLTKGGDIIRSRTYDPLFPLLAVALIYFIIVSIMTRVLARVERRLRQSDSR